MEAILTPKIEEESQKRENPVGTTGSTHQWTASQTYQSTIPNQERFTDQRSEDVVRGWLCQHGTKQIREEFPDFSQTWLNQSNSLIWKSCEKIEGRGDNPDICTITIQLREDGQLALAGGAEVILPSHETWAVVQSAISSLRTLHRKKEVARIGKGLEEGYLPLDDAHKQLTELVEASRGHYAPIDNDVPIPALSEDAYFGIAGQIVRKIEPESEAHPAALLVQLLVGMGNIMGRDPYFLTEADKQHINLFGVIVGESSSGGKGTSWGRIRSILEHVDPVWFSTRILKGMGSGEAFISLLEDDDDNPKDKRLLVMEGEFATVLQVMSRQSCTLGSMLRDAWDSTDLQNHCKGVSMRASSPHASLLAHITPTEPREKLTENDAANGFLNRILLVHSSRTKSLPLGGKPLQWDEEIRILQGVVQFAQNVGAMSFSQEAKDFWFGIYDDLKENIPSGLWGQAVTRACPKVVRLSLIYALMDLSQTVGVKHLRAAKAVWDYCHASARWALEEYRLSEDARRIYEALCTGAKDRTHIVRSVFNGKRNQKQIDIALKELGSEIDEEIQQTSGAPKRIYKLKKAASL
jgi:hypothetical protein